MYDSFLFVFFFWSENWSSIYSLAVSLFLCLPQQERLASAPLVSADVADVSPRLRPIHHVPFAKVG